MKHGDVRLMARIILYMRLFYNRAQKLKFNFN